MRVGVEERIELPGGQPERQAQSLLQAAPEAVQAPEAPCWQLWPMLVSKYAPAPRYYLYKRYIYVYI